MEIIGLFLSLIVFLFSLYSLSKDDFVLLRKNISMDQIFNISFLALFAGLFSARVVFVISHFSQNYLSPLVFFVLPYFPGISIIGGVIGSVLFVLYYTSYKKIHTERLFDFFNTSLLFALSFGYVFHDLVFLIAKKPLVVTEAIIPVFLIVLSVVYISVLLPRHRRGEMKDGHIGLIFMVCFSLVLLAVDVFSKNGKVFAYVGVEGIVAFLVFAVSLVFLLKREKRVIKFAKIRI